MKHILMWIYYNISRMKNSVARGRYQTEGQGRPVLLMVAGGEETEGISKGTLGRRPLALLLIDNIMGRDY